LAQAGAQASSFDRLLEESRDLVCARIGAALGAMLDKADEALVDWIGKTQNRETQSLYQGTRELLRVQRSALETGFVQSYLSEFAKLASRVKDPGRSFADIDTSLHLVGEDDLDETLKFKNVATKLRRFCDDELAALDQRVGVLFGDANLAAEANPFGPESICDAFQQACHALEATAQVRGVLLKLFDDHVVDAVRPIYKDVNTLLIENAILPKIRYGVSKNAEGAPAKAAGEKQPAPAAGAATAGGGSEQDLFTLLQKLVGGGAGGLGQGGGGVALPPGVVVVQGAELLGMLTQVQHGDVSALPGGVPAAFAQQASAGTTNVLRELKTSTFGAGLVQMDATTLDILSLVFDQLFDDANIPIALKGLIGRLQIPMLKVAIADKAFFANKAHAARRLLDAFGELAPCLPADFRSDSPDFMRLEAITQHILDNFQQDVGLFDGAREQLEAFIAEHDKQVETETRALAQRVEQTETLGVAKAEAEQAVKARVQTHKMPGVVLEFLVEHWLRVLLLAHVKSGAGGAEWKGALEVMDELVWSVGPIHSLEERQKLAKLVPGLVRRITAGLQALAASDDVRTRFFGELMKIHTESLEPKAKPTKAPDKAEAPAAAQPPQAPPPIDFSAPVKIKNPYGAGEVEVIGLDFTVPPVDEEKRARAKAALQSSLMVYPPKNIELGTWVAFNPKDGKRGERTAKVLFVSPKQTRYVFSDRRGKNIVELTRAQLVHQLRTGEAVRLEGAPEAPLFDRIMTGLLDKLRTPAPRAA